MVGGCKEMKCTQGLKKNNQRLMDGKDEIRNKGLRLSLANGYINGPKNQVEG